MSKDNYILWHETLISWLPAINAMRGVLIPLLEKWLRLIDGTKLLAHKLVGLGTVKEIINAEAISNGRKFLIFATYPSENLLENHVRLLKKFEARGYAIVIASNSNKAKCALAPLLHQSWTFVFRRPCGRDFGCYKDCALMLYEHAKRGGAIERIILLNDSVITLASGEDRVVEHLDNPAYPYAGITENYEFSYHVGSFMLAMSGEAFMSKRVSNYWKKYQPISTRRYSIHMGEMGLTKALKRSGYEPRVLYTLGGYKHYLQTLGLRELESIYRYMEPRFINTYGSFTPKLDGSLDAFIRDDRKQEIESGIGKALITTWPRLNNKKQSDSQMMPQYIRPQLQDMSESAKDFDERKLYVLRYRERLLDWSEENQKDLLIKRAKEEIIDSMVSFIFRGSQIHSANAVLLYMGAGIIKKDVIYRGHMEPYNLELILRESGACTLPSELSDISKEVLAKGHPYSFHNNLIRRLMYQWGFE